MYREYSIRNRSSALCQTTLYAYICSESIINETEFRKRPLVAVPNVFCLGKRDVLSKRDETLIPRVNYFNGIMNFFYSKKRFQQILQQQRPVNCNLISTERMIFYDANQKFRSVFNFIAGFARFAHAVHSQRNY